MRSPERADGSGPDWRCWFALAWALGCGVLYVHMVLAERAPGLLRRIAQVSGLGGG